MDVNIYIENDIKNFYRQDGYYGYEVEYVKSDGNIEERHKESRVDKTTVSQISLIALYSALQILTKPCNVTVYMNTDNNSIKSTIEHGYLQKWQQNNWKNGHGDTVRNKSEWQQLICWMKGHEISIRSYKEVEDKITKIRQRIERKKNNESYSNK